ncbi:hypothetical protein GCM10023189_22600 [Nibrella saemangeumensis]|uniref:Kinase n=1 Tax=Nibrella saemangeumensis TaxID=1084526 RepID=A0ABP8MUL2_9BACT
MNQSSLQVPAFSLILLIGVSGAGKSTFARRHFLPTEVISSDHCRALITDNENDQSATGDAFELLHWLAAKRLQRRRLTVIDATNVQADARQSLIDLGQQFNCPLVAIVLDMPEQVLNDRRKTRTDRSFADPVLHRQRRDLWLWTRYLEYEGFSTVYRLKSADEVDQIQVVRQS